MSVSFGNVVYSARFDAEKVCDPGPLSDADHMVYRREALADFSAADLSEATSYNEQLTRSFADCKDLDCLQRLSL